MEVRPGYKQSEVGVIPEEWEVKTLGEIGDVRMCKRVLKQQTRSHGDVPFYKIGTFGGVANAYISGSLFEEFRRRYSFPKKGDVLISAAGTIGRSVVFDGASAYFQDSNIVWIENDESKATNEYLWHRYQVTKWAVSHGGTVARLYNDSLRTKIYVPVPPLPEQRAIAAALSDVDALLGGLDRLIAKKRDLKQAAMQQLLTGQTRLPGFSGAWEVKRIAEIGIPSAEKNTDGATLPVLTCSKHFGFMDSLGFFKNQVFSKDLSTYRVIRRDEIGYPANHVEEGSIGLQYLYDIALVSPIYVVFRVAAEVSSFFLHRLLKLDSYRQRFKTATTSSVDRRGSLRWRAFSEITVELPPMKAEQTAIAAVLSDMDAELAALEARRDKTRDLKQAMMQELLTGRTRLL